MVDGSSPSEGFAGSRMDPPDYDRDLERASHRERDRETASSAKDPFALWLI
jgi:hypothetical protein